MISAKTYQYTTDYNCRPTIDDCLIVQPPNEYVSYYPTCPPNEWAFYTYPEFNSGGVFDNAWANQGCTTVVDSVCPTIGGTSGGYTINPFFSESPINARYVNTLGLSENITYLSSNYKQMNQIPVTCNYDLDSFQTFEDILKFQRAFITTASAYNPQEGSQILNTEIMPSFCSIPSSNCPLDPLKPGESVTLFSCSRFTSTDTEGDMCRTWEEEYPTLADQVKIEFCSQPNAFNSSECACINKLYNEEYRALKKNVNAPDSCWYIPCANSTQFLITSTEILPEPNTSCPDTCGVIINNYDTSTVNFSTSQILVDCVKGASTYVPTPSPSPTGPVEEVKTIWDEYQGLIIGIIVGVIALIIIIGIAVGISKKNKIKSSTSSQPNPPPTPK